MERIDSKSSQVSVRDMIVEIHNHVKQVIEKFKKRKKEMIASVRAEINYQIAIKVNKVT